ncbi:MAG: proteasome accessory factor PafA2 [Candidatus Tectomicrobia bacterium]|nr:proteasome accessory factor PafA2 [Candidatus Tectomicrobia bacterium]
MAEVKIIGTETEYGITSRNPEKFDPITSSMLLVNSYESHKKVRILWDYNFETPLLDTRGFQLAEEVVVPDDEDNLIINKVLTNGARYYVDHAHPEYSTPECLHIRDLVAHEKAGEQVLNLSRIEAESQITEPHGFILYKNNTDRKGNSYGCHENYLMNRTTPFKDIVGPLIPFLVTRQVYAGSGKIGVENDTDPVAYQISQRADFFETDIGLDTTTKRPIINTRDEPHADRAKYRRLHVIVGDSNMSEFSVYLKVGVTSLILRMIEDGKLKKYPRLRDPVRAIKEISRDPACKKPVKLQDRREFTGVEIQMEYLDLARRYFQGTTLDENVSDILDKWEMVLEKLRDDPMELDRHLDWVIKKNLITTYMERRGCDWDDPRVSMIDLQYHDIRSDKGLYYILCQQGKVERIVTDEEISKAIEYPPLNTRAYFRGVCRRKYASDIYSMNWDSITFSLDDGPVKRIMMAEPARGSQDLVEELLLKSPTASALLTNIAQ